MAVGFRLRGGTRLTVELALLFGSGFLEDPLHPWAAQALDTPPFVTEQRRARRLHDAVHDYLGRLFGGPADAPAMHNLTLRRVLQLDGFGLDSNTWQEALASRLEHYFPTRTALAAGGAFRRLVDDIAGRSAVLKLKSPNDIGHCVALQVGFGHRWYRDPALGWTRHALAAGGVARLRRAALDRLPTTETGGSS